MNTDNQRKEEQQLRHRLRGQPGIAPEDTLSELLEEERKKNTSTSDDLKKLAEEAKAQADLALEKQAEDELRRRKEREMAQAMQSDNTMDVRPQGTEIEREDLIMPRRLVQTYSEVEGKFFAKDSNRLMFEDRGEKLATSTTNKEAIADMILYAKAKQWESLKLSGSQDFRREAWLQAESQGIRTQGYTPKDKDLAELKTLTEERAVNIITPLQERKQEQKAYATAPRHDLNKNQAAMHVEATKAITENLQTLQKNPTLANKSVEELTKLAYWRGVVMEENKFQTKPTQDEALARFDKQAQDPQFLKRIAGETQGSIQDKTTDRTQKRETFEQSL